MRGKNKLQSKWQSASDDAWRESLKQGRCLAGCNLEANGLVCMHLQGYLLKGGKIKPWLNIDVMPLETYRFLAEPNEPKERVFRELLAPLITDVASGIPGFITTFQADILVLRHVYDQTWDVVATELGCDESTARRQAAVAHNNLKSAAELLKGDRS